MYVYYCENDSMRKQQQQKIIGINQPSTDYYHSKTHMTIALSYP